VGVIISLLKDWRNLIRVNDVVNYIYARQNEDGGYTFARGTESSAQDTYYAVETLRMLGAELKNVDKTVLFLRCLQHRDGNFDSVKIAYYVTEALSLLGSKPAKPMDRLAQSLEVLIGGLKNPDAHIELVSEIENVYLAVKLLNTLNFSIDSDRVVKQILRLQNADGSFGSRRHSRIASTCYALRT
jgi:hypothetical protein